METEPQLLHLMAPNEAVVAIGIEVRIGETVGMMNIAMPSIVIKMMRQKFDQQWSVRKTHASEAEQARCCACSGRRWYRLEARLEGPTLACARPALAAAQGQLLTVSTIRSIGSIELTVNGCPQIHCPSGSHREESAPA